MIGNWKQIHTRGELILLKFKESTNHIFKQFSTYKATADRGSCWSFDIFLVLFFSVSVNTILSLLE